MIVVFPLITVPNAHQTSLGCQMDIYMKSIGRVLPAGLISPIRVVSLSSYGSLFKTSLNDLRKFLFEYFELSRGWYSTPTANDLQFLKLISSQVISKSSVSRSTLLVYGIPFLMYALTPPPVAPLDRLLGSKSNPLIVGSNASSQDMNVSDRKKISTFVLLNKISDMIPFFPCKPLFWCRTVNPLDVKMLLMLV